MAFKYTNAKGVTYILHGKDRVTSTGKTTTLYYFGKEEKKDALAAVPAGYKVSETTNGLPVLKKV